MSKPKPKDRVRELYLTASAASVGLELALGVIIGWAIGMWLDGLLGTDPWMMLLFFCIGTAAGFKGVLRIARESKRADEESNRQEPAAPSAPNVPLL